MENSEIKGNASEMFTMSTLDNIRDIISNSNLEELKECELDIKGLGFSEYSSILEDAIEVENMELLNYLLSIEEFDNIQRDQLRTVKNSLLIKAISKDSIDLFKLILALNPELIDLADQNKNTPLHISVKYNRTKITQYLIEKGADVSLKDNTGQLAIHYVIKWGDFNLVKLMLKKVPHLINYKDRFGNTLLNTAIKLKKEEAISYLIEAGAKTDLANKLGQTALHIALDLDNADVIKALLEKDAKLINLSDGNKNTLLHISIKYGKEKVTRYLVDKSDLNLVNSDGQTVLHIASEIGNLDITKLILKEKPSLITVLDRDNKTALDLAIKYEREEVIKYLIASSEDSSSSLEDKKILYKVIKEGDLYILDKILKRSSQLINSVDKCGNTPLHIAVKYSRTEVVEYLIDRDADISIKDQLGRIAISIAIENGNIYLVKLLLVKSPELINSVDKCGNTLLHTAIICGQKEITGYLIEQEDIYISLTDILKQTPLHLAAKIGDLDTIKLLLAKDNSLIDTLDKYKATPLYLAFIYKQIEAARYLIGAGADVNLKDSEGQTFLHIAIISMDNLDDMDVITSILKKFPKLINSIDQFRRTPLNIAILCRKSKIATYLIDEGADISLANSLNQTPLHLAAEIGDLDTIKSLLKEDNSLINLLDKNKDTPLHLALKNVKTEAVRYLIGARADVSIKDGEEKTSLHLAIEFMQDIDIISLIIKEDHNLIEVLDKYNRSPLNIAIEHRKKDIFKLLLDSGANIGLNNKSFKKTLIHEIIRNCNVEALELILDKNYDINLTEEYESQDLVNILDVTRETPLSLAILLFKEEKEAEEEFEIEAVDREKYKKMIYLLLNRYIDNNMKNEYPSFLDNIYGNPFHSKEGSLSFSIAKHFIDKGLVPDTAIKTKSNINILTLALLESDYDIIHFIIKRSLLSTIEESYKELEAIEKAKEEDLSDKKRLLEPLLLNSRTS